jgi:hypothetical protein
MEGNDMNMPGFTAEISLYQNGDHYHGAAGYDQDHWVIPQMRAYDDDGNDCLCIQGFGGIPGAWHCFCLDSSLRQYFQTTMRASSQDPIPPDIMI